MARRRGRYSARLTRNQKFAGSAVIAGLLLAAVHGHTPGPAATASAPAAIAGCGGSNEALANCMAAAAPTAGPAAQTTCLDWLWTRESNFETGATNPLAARTASRSRCPPRRWPPPGRTGRPARPRRSGGASATSPPPTARPCGAWSHEQAAGWY